MRCVEIKKLKPSTMDIREFAQEFQDNVNTASEMGNNDYDTELAGAILEYP